MDFDIEDRICSLYHCYVDYQTHHKISELIQSALTTANKEQARRLLDWADSLAYKAYIAVNEMEGEFKHDSNEVIKRE